MPTSVIVGGQYGSEGKGKVALFVANEKRAAAVVRVGGPNSGHTGVDSNGRTWVFRQLPAASLSKDALVVIAAGSLINPDILLEEIGLLGLSPDRLIVDARATIILQRHRDWEAREALTDKIGSTGSGTGAALIDRISRSREHMLAGDCHSLAQFIVPNTSQILRGLLRQGKRVVVEGTQGFGLSLWHGPSYPSATSRDTTASAFMSESGLAPHDADDVVLVLRSFPIRVGGNSGPLEHEIDWPTLAAEARLPPDYVELTSATRRVRRVARFDAEIVKRAIEVNAPHRIAMNHIDYVDPDARSSGISPRGIQFIGEVEDQIGRRIDLIGIGPASLVARSHSSTLKIARHAG